MLKEYSIRNDESNFPVCLLDTFCKRLITQTRPTLYESSHFFRCMFPVVTNWAGTYQDSSDAITFYIIIDPVACRYRKEFHTRVSPYRTVIFSILGTYTLLFHFKM